MVISKKLISAGCAAMLAASMCAPAMAFADNSTNLNIEAKGTAINVTIPTGSTIGDDEKEDKDPTTLTNPLTFIFPESGLDIHPSNYYIQSESAAPIKLNNISFSNEGVAEDDIWQIVEDNTALTTSIDERKFSLKVTGYTGLNEDNTGGTAEGSAVVATDSGINISHTFSNGDKFRLGFETNHGAFSSLIEAHVAKKVTYNFSWANADGAM